MSEATIMIVEDDTGTRRTLRGILEDTGYQVIEAERASDALKVIRENSYDLVITDIRLPDASGMEIVREARAIKPEAAVMIITGYASVETATEAVRQGAYAYFTKPVSPAELVIDITNALKQQRLMLENKQLLDDFQRANKELRREVTERKRAEQALRESEQKLNSMFQSTTDFITVMARDLDILWTNEQIKKVFGDDIIGRKCYQVYHKRKEPCKPYPCPTLKAFKDGKVHEREMQVADQDGNPIYLHCITNVALRDKNRKPTAVMEILRDITERKRAEAALTESEARYRSLVNNSQVGISRSTPEPMGRFLEVNPAMEKMFGYSRDELMKMKVSDLYMHPEDRVVLTHEVSSLGQVRRELSQRKKDGSEVVILATITGVRDEKGEVLYFDSILEDITERKKMTEELAKSEARYRSLVNNVTLGILRTTLGPPGRILELNPTMEEITGYSREELLAIDMEELYIHPEERQALMRELVTTEEGIARQLHWRKKDGSEIVALCKVITVRDEAGKVLYFDSILEDITERKRIAEALRESEEKYRSLVNNVQLGIYRVAPEAGGRFLEVNSAMERIYGYSRGELLKIKVSDLYINPEDRVVLVRELSSLGQVKKEFHQRRKDGREVVISATITGIRDEKGEVVYFDGINEDITERKRLEEDLREEQQELKLIIDSSPITVFYKDKEGRFVRVNRAFAEALEMSEEEFVGKTVFDLYSAETAQNMTNDDQEVLNLGRPKFNIVEQHESASGMRWAQTDKVPILNKDGIPVGLLGFAQDITERKRAEEALRESEKRYRTVFENTGTATAIVEQDMTISLANEECERLFGYSRGELEGKKSWTEFVAKEDLERMKEYHQLRRKDPASAPRSYEFHAIDRKGNVKDILITTAVIPGTAKSVASVLDITERKRAEEALRESEEKYRTLVESATDFIYMIDTEDRILSLNQSVARFLGKKPGELIGKKVFDMFPKEMGARFAKEFRLTFKTGRTLMADGKIDVGGKEIWASTSLNPIRNDNSEVVAVMGVTRDITEQKRMERELQEKNEQLDAQNEALRLQSEEMMAQQQELIEKTEEVARANQLKSEFLANMSHELRTPLNTIIGFSQLMLDGVPGPVNKEQQQCLSDVLDSSRHLLNLINEVLDLSKIESGRTELKQETVTLTEVLESLARSMLPILRPRKQRLDVEIEEGLSPIYADKGKLGQVLRNLVANSSNFTPDGGTLKIEATSDDGWCRVSVIDSGSGIKTEDKERIFEPFCQLDYTSVRGKGGTGLGLAVVKQIIEKHGGRVWVESDYGQGSQFTFTLPLVTKDTPPKEGDQP